MNIKESIRRILRESTFFLRRIDMSLMEKEFFETLNYATDIFLRRYDNNQPFDFKTFKRRVIDYLMDDYHDELSNGGSKDFPYDEVYGYLSNHFHDKIKDRYDTHFGRNINESESKQERKFTKLLNNIQEYLNSNSYDSVVRFMVDYDEVMDDVIVNIFFDAEHAVKLGGGINRVIKSTGKKIMEDLSVFPFDFKYHIHFERPQLNESEDNEEKKIQKNLTVLRKLISMFDYSEVCDMWVEYEPEDGYYAIRSKMNTKNHNTKALEKEFEFLEESIKSLGLKAYISHPYWVEECEDENKLNESEDKNQSFLSFIEEYGLYEFMKMTGLSLPQIYTKTGELPREVLEGYIKDFIKQEGYHQTNGEVQLIFTVEIQKNIQIEQFYMEGDKVTVEISGYNDYGKQTDGYIESLSNLTDDEIFTIVENMIKWITYSEM